MGSTFIISMNSNGVCCRPGIFRMMFGINCKINIEEEITVSDDGINF